MVIKKRTEEKLGEILLRQGIISEEQLRQALEAQKAEKGLLGEILTKQGYVDEYEIAQAISSQYGFPFISLDNYDFNTEAVRLVPENIARQYKLVPIDLIGGILVVAMADPLNKTAIEDIEMISHKKVRAFLAVITSVNEVLGKAYGKKKPANRGM